VLRVVVMGSYCSLSCADPVSLSPCAPHRICVHKPPAEIVFAQASRVATDGALIAGLLDARAALFSSAHLSPLLDVKGAWVKPVYHAVVLVLLHGQRLLSFRSDAVETGTEESGA